MAVSGVGTGFVFQGDCPQKKENRTKDGDLFGKLLEESGQTEAGKERGETEKAAAPFRTEKIFCGRAVMAQEEDPGAEGKVNSAMTTQEMMQEIRKKIEELYDKVKKGETEQSFQIGASSFTLKEWERFIERFDKVQEELEELIREAREMMRKEMAERAAENEEEKTQ